MQQTLWNMTTIENLRQAEEKAALLFDAVQQRGLIVSGKSEKQLNKEVYELAKELYGVKKHWHKRIIRAGINTLSPYSENPADLILQEDDILFFDLGPVFETWEADFGRTYVLGEDAIKHKLKNDIETAWHECKEYYDSNKNSTGAELYAHAVSLAAKYGWEFGSNIAGHIIGKFPHEKLEPEQKDNYIHALNHQSMTAPDKKGNKRDWILEIHFIDRERQIGGFFEQLLT